MSGIGEILDELIQIADDREKNPVIGSYTNYLLSKGEDKVLNKFGEECVELIVAAKNHDKSETIHEIADVLYHLTILLYQEDIEWEKVESELRKRRETTAE